VGPYLPCKEITTLVRFGSQAYNSHLKRVKGIPFWGFWAEGPTTEMPDGVIDAVAVGCNNPSCKTKCPGVAVTFVVQGHRYEIRMDPAEARELGASIIEQSNTAQPVVHN
jgi:hypothetical protein